MRKDPLSWLAVLSLSLLAIAACTSSAQPVRTTVETTTTTIDQTTTTEGGTPEVAPTGELLVWADEVHAGALEKIVPAFQEKTGVSVVIELVDIGSIREKVGVASPAGEGPDIFIGASDWVGDLGARGILEPMQLGATREDFTPSSLQALTYEGILFGLPYAIEAIAMYYNTDLVSDPPTTMEEAAAICSAIADITNCIGVSGGGDSSDAYHLYPFVSAQGGYIFGSKDDIYDPTDIGLDSAGAIAGAQALEALVTAGAIAPTNYQGAKSQFLDGTEPFWITGPWELGTLNNQTTVNWSVAKLPKIAGGTPRPFVGVQAFFLSSFSESKPSARTFLVDFVASEAGMAALFAADGRPPTHKAVVAAAADDQITAAFSASAADGVPIPNISAMGPVWRTLGDNLQLLRNSELDGQTAMLNTAATIRESVNQ